jgi:23S rRNA (guanosine2251-2'-O)-methyltransferase
MQALYGFHAVSARLRHAPDSIRELLVDANRRDRRMQHFLEKAVAAGLQPIPADEKRLTSVAGHGRHQGVVALAEPVQITHSLYDVLDAAGSETLLLVLDSITDPHNLGACLRVADGAGAHAVIAPKDRACGITPVVAKVASGAVETVPYITVTNLARTMGEIADSGVRLLGAAGEVNHTLFTVDAKGPVAWVLGAEGEGLRRLTREKCDELVSIPMAGAVESLNVSVASSLCLYETVRQRARGAGG